MQTQGTPLAESDGHSPDLELKTATGMDLNLPLAGIGSRAYAFLIDWHIRFGLCLLWILAWLGMLSFEIEGLFDSRLHLWGVGILPSLFYMLYHPIVEVFMRGNSPGKMWIGISCVDASGMPPSTGAILLRNIMRLIDGLPAFYGIGTAFVMFTKQQVRLGDMVANTRVVVVSQTSKAALSKLETLRSSGLPPEQAELAQELLERWSSLEEMKRNRYAKQLLKQLNISPKHGDKALHRQLKSLFENK